jgi:hypothetical protein
LSKWFPLERWQEEKGIEPFAKAELGKERAFPVPFKKTVFL